MRIYTGCDHAGFALRNKLVERLKAQGHEVIDFGTNSDAACDYPDYAGAVANAVRSDPGSVGMLFCATGHGTAMAAGKVRGVRAFSPTTVEAARLSRFDNDSNVLCLGGRTLPDSEAFEIADTWLSTGFAGGRHARRIAKVSSLETASALAFLTESEYLRLAARDLPNALWRKDGSAFERDPAQQEKIQNRLGWLGAPQDLEGKLAGIQSFAEEVRRSGFRRAVILGTGGSSLAAEVLARVFGPSSGWLNVFVLDSTSPTAIATVEHSIDIDRTLFIVASKSGDTVDINALERYFWGLLLKRADAGTAGQHFVAITDPDTELAARAQANHYRQVFLNQPDMGGRYSALSCFGLVPASLLGMDIAKLAARARAMSSACREPNPAKNPGASLGTLMGALAKHGRDKLTLFISPEIAPLGAWIEHLLAESTGKLGRGIIPIDGEPPGSPSSYRPDRFFVTIRLRNGTPPIAPEQQEAIAMAGHPMVELELGDRHDLGAEFFRWEFATAIAGSVLQVNPFDEPDVADGKKATRHLLEAAQQGDPAKVEGVVGAGDDAVVRHLTTVGPGGYLAFGAFFRSTPERDALLSEIRLLCRDRLKVATTVGYGPRVLHSTGQLHKGGPNTGVFVQLAARVKDGADLPIPDQPMTFGQLLDAETLGDLQALRHRGRSVLRVELGDDPDASLRKLVSALRSQGQRQP